MAERQDPDDAEETGFGTDAKLYRLRRLSTADFDSGDRFNAWRETAYNIADLEPPKAEDGELVGTKRAVRGAIGLFASHEGSVTLRPRLATGLPFSCQRKSIVSVAANQRGIAFFQRSVIEVMTVRPAAFP